MKSIFFTVLLVLLSFQLLVSKSNLKRSTINKKTKCINNCENPVYLINRASMLTLDIYNDPTKDPSGYPYYSYTKLSNLYHTWCIGSDGYITSNENGLVLVWNGALSKGAQGRYQWDQTLIITLPKGQSKFTEKWQVASENSGFSSIKETYTTGNGVYDRQGWIANSGNNLDAILKNTNANDLAGQWIIQEAPQCS